MNASQTLRLAAATLVVVGLAASPSLAQTPDAIRAEAFLSEAIAAEAQAALTGSARAKEEVARLHVQSANARSYNDPLAVSSLRTAALYISHTQPREAADLLAQAAERALAMGDIVTAATSYLDAAAALTEPRHNRISAEEFNRVERWVIQAQMLAESPLLEAGERELILRRATPVDIGNFAG